MKTQSEMIYEYSKTIAPKFNEELFTRSDEKIIQALKNVIMSCERKSFFTIKVLDFQVIEDYDDINHILWCYEDNLINKNRNPDNITEELPLDKVKKKSSPKCDNQYDCINLKKSAVKLLKITYFIEITEKKDGLVNDTVVVYMAVPRIVDGGYMKLNGKLYLPMFQIRDASTYNNSTSINAKKQSIVFSTFFGPIRGYRYVTELQTLTGEKVPCIYFLSFIFKKTVNILKYIFAKFGYYETLRFLKINYIMVLDDIDDSISLDDNYIFESSSLYVVIPRKIYDEIPIAQAIVYTLLEVIGSFKSVNLNMLFRHSTWHYTLGTHFATRDSDYDAVVRKGLSILESLEFTYDVGTKNDLMLSEEDKGDIFRTLRWLVNEFSSLRLKDNLDISTKKLTYADYIASMYAMKVALGIFRIADKGANADLNTIKKAIKVSPMYLIKRISNDPLINYNDCVNDLDSTSFLKYTFKGIGGIGDKSNSVPVTYRTIHPSHMGRLDLDSSSNSDPGVSGSLCPSTFLYNDHFSKFEEISTWEEDINRITSEYRNMTSRKDMFRLIETVSNKPVHNVMVNECINMVTPLLDYVMCVDEAMHTEDSRVTDVFGDGSVLIVEEE